MQLLEGTSSVQGLLLIAASFLLILYSLDLAYLPAVGTILFLQ